MTELPTPLTPADCDLPSSREAAAESGAVRYFSGDPCPSGHVTARYTLNGYCVECQRIQCRANRNRIKAKRGGV